MASPDALELDAAMLAALVSSVGPLAIVDLETTGLAEDADSELLELGALLVDAPLAEVVTLRALVRPRLPIPPAVQRLTGLCDADVAAALPLAELAPSFARALEGRTVVAHNAAFERHFLARCVSKALEDARFLDTQDLLAVTHPDAPDLRLESFGRLLLGREERHRALDDALDTARVLSCVARGARAGEPRYAVAREALESFAPESPWLAILGKPRGIAGSVPTRPYLSIGSCEEPPVPFDEEAIAAALADEARGRRHFSGYRVRAEQIRLARHFARTFASGGVLLLEGGTGVGKSLAYLAAAIPFAICRAAAGAREPVIVSTRTKLLQDQLLFKDIGAAARFLGHPELRALSIKGRANYACARRLEHVLEEGLEPRIFAEDRMAWAVLVACARTRAHGEVGSVPAALRRRYGPLRDLLRRSVTSRAEQCTREQCAARPDCPLGRRRAALADAHLVVANHDLLLRWPPDYPALGHAVVDEVHELAAVADEVYATEVSPESVLDRLDEVFGRPDDPGRGNALLSRSQRRALERDARAWRRGVQQDLAALGRALGDHASEFGEVQLPERPLAALRPALEIGSAAAARLEGVAESIAGLEAARDEASAAGGALGRAEAELRGAAASLRLALEGGGADAVAAFEALEPPWDRWRLVVRAVSPAEEFHEHFLSRLQSFAGVSASLFVGGDAFAALGELELEERTRDRLERVSVRSPFPYAEHMRVVALESRGDLVLETAEVLERLARRLRGRTLGLFTSLRRMRDVAELLAARLRGEGIEVLTPRRAADDPAALVARFCAGDAVLLGARSFWQGLDIAGSALQAVVIEKLPFEVPTELRRRREARLRAAGIDAFERYSLGKMLLNLKQMVGRLIRSEEDRGIVVLVEGRSDRPYFARLGQALPPGSSVELLPREELERMLAEVGI